MNKLVRLGNIALDVLMLIAVVGVWYILISMIGGANV